MRAVVILLDSLARHYLSTYGNDWTVTPNINRLAERSVVFDNHWLGSAPCMPARRDMLTGRFSFLERGWGGMEPFDTPLPHVLSQNNIHCHIETDHYHYGQCGGEFYHTCFTTWQLHRGQEFDLMPTRVDPDETIDPKIVWNRAQYDRNRAMFNNNDALYPTPLTFQGAIDWLQLNKSLDNFLLWVEAFDPHVPYDAPLEYLNLYDDTLREDNYMWNKGDFDEMQTRYAATLTMADRWLGKLLDELERQNMFDDTLIIFTTDHGEMHGQQGGIVGKNHCHAYNELAHLPLFVHLPGNQNAGERRNQLTQSVDLFPTLTQYFNTTINHSIHGIPFLDIAINNNENGRDCAIYGWYAKTVNITDGKYTLMKAPQNSSNSPLYQYFLTPTHYHRLFDKSVFDKAEFGYFLKYTDVPVIRTPGASRGEFGFHDELFESRFYDIENDYAQTHNLYDDADDLTLQYLDLLRKTMRQIDAPEEQFERLGLD